MPSSQHSRRWTSFDNSEAEIPLTEVSLSTRSPALESQNPGSSKQPKVPLIRRLFSQRTRRNSTWSDLGSAEYREIEAELKRVLEDHPNQQSLVKHFRKVFGNLHGDTFGHFVIYKSVARSPGNSNHEADFSNGKTWGDGFNHLRVDIQHYCHDVFSFCAIVSNSGTISRSFTSAQDVPGQLVLHQICNAWKLVPSDQYDLVPRVTTDSEVQYRKVFDFKWIRDAPQYATDLSVYVWQSFAEAPKSDEELSVISFHDSNESLHRIIMIVKTRSLMDRFRKLPLSFQRSSPPVPWQYQAIEIFQSCLELVRNDTTRFASRVASDLEDTKYQFRRSPSGSKIQYLHHVKDCLKVAEQATHDSLIKIAMLPTYLEGFLDRPLDDAERDQLAVLQTDFNYIKQTLNELHALIDSMSKNTRQMLELAQIRRSFLLTIAAAVYIPLSFVSSFFGMNINSLDPKSQSYANVTAVVSKTVIITSTTQGSTIPLTSTTLVTTSMKTLNATPDENQSWAIGTFWAIAVPLTIGTIFVPLIIGAAIQSTLKYAVRSRQYWRSWVIPGVKWPWWRVFVLLAAAILMYGRVLLPSFGWFFVMSIPIYCVMFWNLVNASVRLNWGATFFWLANGVYYELFIDDLIVPAVHPFWIESFEYTDSGRDLIASYYSYYSHVKGVARLGVGSDIWYLFPFLYLVFTSLAWWLKPRWFFGLDDIFFKRKTE